MDANSEARLGELHPKLTDLMRVMADMLAAEGVVIRVTQGLRSWAQQQALWQQGRDATGKVIGKTVTDAPPGYSWHQFGLACDVAPFVNGNPDWNAADSNWQRILTVGKSLGLVEGACWHSMPDDPHFQLSDYPVTPTDEDRQLFKDGGQAAVWEHYRL